MASLEQRIAEVRRKIAQLDKTLTSDAKQFGEALTDIVRLKTEEEALLLVRKAVIDLLVRIRENTPIDTGRAQASWQFGIGVEPEGKVPEGDYKDKVAKIAAKTVEEIASAPAGEWFIANHLDYIEALEAGWSKQQPAGMVALALREFTREMQKRVVL